MGDTPTGTRRGTLPGVAANSRWPFPGEPPLVRARRVAHAYRALAEQAGADTADLDARIKAWGESWAIPRLTTCGPDDMLTASEAGDLLATSAAAINNLRRNGRLAGEKDNSGRWKYRARDVTALSARPRSRKPRATDTLHDNGRSVSA